MAAVSNSTDDADAPGNDVNDVPTVACSRCDREWDLDYELDDLQAGNRALEQFALDHERHTGHLPDGVAPWSVTCRRCPAEEVFLSERPARRWAETHARHTRHSVTVEHATEDETAIIESDGE
jgi:hypothetical protein